MPLRYGDIFKPSPSFQRSVNLSLDIGNLDFVKRYIPTQASVDVVLSYLRLVFNPGADRASLLIGPYGKGKSHALFLVLSMLSEEGNEAEAVFEELAAKVGDFSAETAQLIRRIRSEHIRMLPVVINDRYLDISQAFLASLQSSLSRVHLSGLMPQNYYQSCLNTIDRWQEEFPATYTDYRLFIEQKGTTAADFETALKRYDAVALAQFQECHRTILAGAEFNPLLESDVPTLYQHVAEALNANSAYSGLFIVFDEFGKYLESSVTYHETPNFKVLQDLAELCGRSKDTCLLMTCISHKTISEYATHLSSSQQSSFRTVEGRFAPIYFTSTFEGSFSLISGALGRNREQYQRFVKKHRQKFEQTIAECTALNCFSGYQYSVEEIVHRCFPMHPLTTLALMKLSERAAQNERTLFTFLSDPSAPLNQFLQCSDGEYQLATVELVYNYFHITIKESSYNPELRDQIIFADALIPTLTEDEGKLIKTIVLFDMLMDSCLLATKPVICAALQWSDDRYQQVVRSLEQAYRIYTRRSDGVLCLMHSTSDSIRLDIRHEMDARRGRIDIADQLAALREPGYTIPRRYNDQFEIVRYFKNLFVSAEQFLRQPSSHFLSENGFADGYVVHLLGNATVEQIQSKLNHWEASHVVVLLPQIPFTCQAAIEECAAIQRLLSKEQDVVAAEELSYYFEDMLQVVNRSFADMFDHQPLCVTRNRVVPCKTISSEISRICEEELFPLSPIINHEMMNRSVISGQMKQARINIINALLTQDDPFETFSKKSAEAAALAAVLHEPEEPRKAAVISLLRNFFVQCEERPQTLGQIYKVLMQPPYGMRKGVLPILIAYVLKDRLNQATLYSQMREQRIDGETLSLFDEHVQDYSLRIDTGSADQLAYLQLLRDRFTPNDEKPNTRDIYDAMFKVVRALPRCARANRCLLTVDASGCITLSDLPPTCLDVRKVLLRIESNPRDALLEKLPQAFGRKPDEECAKAIIRALDELKKYTSMLQGTLSTLIRKRFGASKQNSTHGAMVAWMQKQSQSRLNRAYDTTTTALLSVLRVTDDHTEVEWNNLLAVALTGLPVEDWSDQQAADFPVLLDEAVSAVEEAPEETATDETDGSHIHLSLNGRVLSQSLPSKELEGLMENAYGKLRADLNKFANALSTEDKLLVLATLMVRMSEKEP